MQPPRNDIYITYNLLVMIFISPSSSVAPTYRGPEIERKCLYLPSNVMHLVTRLAYQPIFQKNTFIHRYDSVIGGHDLYSCVNLLIYFFY